VTLQLRELFPQVGDIGELQFWWSGRVAITADSLPHVHDLVPGLTAVLGYNGRGVAMATALGAAAGQYLVSEGQHTLPVPARDMAPIPFHAGRRAYVAAASAWYRLLDRFGL
jgi:glycine/D-amino acid oxidase-like deaminating enzyme